MTRKLWLRGGGFLGLSFFGLILACSTSPLGRKQLMLVSDEQMNQMGSQAFQQIKTQESIDTDPNTVSYVKCIVAPLTQAARGQTPVDNWDVVIFRNPEANAFALPGGKIGVQTGIFKVAKTDAQLATVIAHEIGHVIAKHGAERVSQQAGTQLGLTALGAITQDNPKNKLLMGLMGIGLQVGVILPFSRTQESEADLIGLNLMSHAGFDPEQSVELWKNMMTSSKGQSPPQWLSTHPASQNRIQALQDHMSEARVHFNQARTAGHSPSCDRSKLKL